MQLRWTDEAVNDLEHIADYLLLHAPDRAHELIQRIYDAPSSLITLPTAAGLESSTVRASMS